MMRWKVITVLVITLLCVCLSSCSQSTGTRGKFKPDYTPGNENTIGNTLSNIQNFGRMAKQDNWIYYSFGGSNGLYKIPIGGSANDIIKLSDQGGAYINVIKDWIYYSANRSIYKIKTDGSESHVLCDDLEYDVTKLFAVDEFIYYASPKQSDASTIPWFITKLNPLNGVKTYLNRTGHSGGLGYINDDEICYYVDLEISQIWVLMDMKGTSKDEFPHDLIRDGEMYPGNIIFDEDKNIYGMIRNDNYFDRITKITPQGEHTVFAETASTNALAIYEDILYFSIDGREETGLYSMNIDGTNKTKINNDPAFNIFLVGDGYIYYQSFAGGESIEVINSRCKLDGSDWSNLDWMIPER